MTVPYGSFHTASPKRRAIYFFKAIHSKRHNGGGLYIYLKTIYTLKGHMVEITQLLLDCNDIFFDSTGFLLEICNPPGDLYLRKWNCGPDTGSQSLCLCVIRFSHEWDMYVCYEWTHHPRCIKWPPFWQTTFLNAFSWTDIFVFWLKCHWSCS